MGRAALLVVLVVSVLGSAATAHAKLRFEPLTQTDARDVASGPLDIEAVAFGQQDTRMFLRVRARSPWEPADLHAIIGRSLCVVLLHHPITTPRTRVCVGSAEGKPVLRYASLDGTTGQAGPEHPVPATIVRPDARTLEARFTPLDVELPTGSFSWQLVSRWTDGGLCASATPCVDRVPDAGPVGDRRVLLAQPRCFGAASLARRRCVSAALRLAVVPKPAESLISGNAPCESIIPPTFIYVCNWGVSRARAATSVALVGDSHSVAWRGALDVVAQHKRWHGYGMSRAGCPLTTAQIVLPTKEASAGCTTWNQLVQLWFRQHPEVSTVIVSAHNARFENSASAGYRAAWKALPSTVKRIYVIRDFPYVGTGKSANCVLRAIKRRQPAGTRCRESRRRALHEDKMARTASRMGQRGRVRYIDMTRHMCDRRYCYPVVGGALVNKPTSHLTRIFSTTVGPFMLRAMNRVG